MIPSYFDLRGIAAPDALPPDAHTETWGAVLTWHRATRRARAVTRTGALWVYAADAWSLDTGAHLWRSWDATAGESVDDWTARERGDNIHDHDHGPWAVPGVVQIADWPVPTAATMREVVPVTGEMLWRAMVTLCAIPVAPDYTVPVPLGGVPAHGSMSRLFNRETMRPRVAWTVPETGMAYRVAVARATHADVFARTGPPVTWEADLRARQALRATMGDGVLDERSVTFEAPRDATTRYLLSAAKQALGITGVPAQRRFESMTWYVTGAPYALHIRRVDG